MRWAAAVGVLLLAAQTAGQLGDVEFEQERVIGHQPAHGGEVEVEHALESEAARDALVRDRRVHVAIADH